jgi:hypothetical protein
MFATLVVGLPSRHEGGCLIVEHDGKTKKIDFGAKYAEFKTQYAAFYADCQTQGSYARRLKQYEVDKKLLGGLEAMNGNKRGAAVKRSSGRRTAKKK